jgi:Nuclease-related domain
MPTGAGASAMQMYRWHRSKRRRRVVAAAGALSLAGLSLARGWPMVLVAVLLGVALIGLAAAVTGPSGRRARRWRHGAEAERRTADLLEHLPPRGWMVWHDLRVPGSRANIDHVVAGRTGVWVIDTKTTSAPVRLGWRSVRFGDRRLDTGPLLWEAEAVASALHRQLGGPPAPIRPLVAVHGPGLRARGARRGGVRVIPADQLVGRLRRGRRRLARGDLDLVAQAIDAAFPTGGIW